MMLPYRVTDSRAYRTLSFSARAVLIAILRKFNGYNNGAIAASQAYLMQDLGTSSPRTVVLAVTELLEHGFLEVTFDGNWKPRRPRTFRLTFISTTQGAVPIRATHEYLDFDGPRRRDKARS